MNKINILKTVSLVGLTAAITACGSDSSTENGFEYNADAMISNVVENVIVAGYIDLDFKADALVTAVINLNTKTNNNTVTESDLDEAQLSWINARSPWEQGESHIFGPVDSLEIDPHLDSWPLATSDLNTVINGISNTYDIDNVLNANDDVQGFHAMEYLLFGDGIASNDQSVSDLTENEIVYLMALTNAFKKYTGDLKTSWTSHYNLNDMSTVPYKDNLTTTGNDFYGSQLAVLEELIDGMIGIVDEVANGKIADPFGTNISTADTSKVESQYSWNSLTDFTDNIRGVLNVYRGEFENEDDLEGIIDFVAAADSELSLRVDSEIVAAIESIQAISSDSLMPFRNAITDETARTRIQTAITTLGVLQASLVEDVKPLLNSWNL